MKVEIFKKDVMHILITAAFGLFAGAYVYVVGFATTFELPEANESDIYKEFVLTGETFGACAETSSCFSFQVLENGAYRALFDDPRTGTSKVVEGRLPYSVKRALLQDLSTPVLTRFSLEKAVPDCDFPETNFRFRVTKEEVAYLFDTCENAIDYKGKAWDTLGDLLTRMAEKTP